MVYLNFNFNEFTFFLDGLLLIYPVFFAILACVFFELIFKTDYEKLSRSVGLRGQYSRPTIEQHSKINQDIFWQLEMTEKTIFLIVFKIYNLHVILFYERLPFDKLFSFQM